MTISISVTVPEEIVKVDGATKYLERALSAIGYQRADMETNTFRVTYRKSSEPSEMASSSSEPKTAAETADGAELRGATAAQAEATTERAEAAEPTSSRLIGKSASGKGRRSAAEIAEDKEIEELAEKAGLSIETINEKLSHGIDRGALTEFFRVATGAKPAISTGEERVDPADVAEQDAADEKRESGDLSGLDALRAASGRYGEKFGFARAVSDLPKLLGCPVVDTPEADIPAAIAKIDAAIAGEEVAPVKAKTAVEKPTTKAEEVTQRTATLDEVMEMAKALVEKLGAETVQGTGPDSGAAIITSAIGEIPEGTKNGKGEVVNRWVFSAIPNDPAVYGKVAAAFEAKLEELS